MERVLTSYSKKVETDMKIWTPVKLAPVQSLRKWRAGQFGLVQKVLESKKVEADIVNENINSSRVGPGPANKPIGSLGASHINTRQLSKFLSGVIQKPDISWGVRT